MIAAVLAFLGGGANATRLALWALATAAVIGLGAFLYLTIKDKGAQEVRTEQAQAAADTERKRVKDDAELRNLSDRDLCVRALSSRGMPIDACAGL